MQADEIVAVIETDKVNVDIRSATAGTITKYFAKEGDTIEVSADFYELDTDGKQGAKAAVDSSIKKEDKKEEKKVAPTDIPKPI